jgi:hypothetical protein
VGGKKSGEEGKPGGGGGGGEGGLCGPAGAVHHNPPKGDLWHCAMLPFGDVACTSPIVHFF